MAIGEVWRASCLGSHSGNELAVVTWHFRMKSAADPAGTIGLYLKTQFIDTVKAQQTSLFRWDSIQFLRVNASPPMSAQYNTAFPIAGTNVGGEAAHQVAVVVTHKTQYAGRSYRGRHYLPAIAASLFTAGMLQNTTRNALQTYYDDIVAGVGGAGSNNDIEWVVWSQKLLTYTPVNDTLVRDNPGIQRRRRMGSGV